MIRAALLLVVGVALTGCALELTTPQPQLLEGPPDGSEVEGLPQGLGVELRVEPGEVAQHGTFTVTLTVTNTTPAPIHLDTAHGCLAIPHVLRDGHRVPFQGSAWGCVAAITTHAFRPGEPRVITWTMQAELYAEHPGDEEGLPAPKGTYLVQAEFETFSPEGPTPNPVVERLLVVR